jgi:hypothetical protein
VRPWVRTQQKKIKKTKKKKKKTSPQVVLAIHELFPSLHLFLMLWGIFMGISLNLYIGRNIL